MILLNHIILPNHMTTIEHAIQQWAFEKRKTLFMTEQESVRIWNVIQSQLGTESLGATATTSVRWGSWVPTFVRWSLVPAMAVILLTVVVTTEGNGVFVPSESVTDIANTATAPEPAPVADVAVAPSPEIPLRSTIAVAPVRKVYAGRNQSVFVAWAPSVYGPGSTNSIENSQNIRAKSVFSD